MKQDKLKYLLILLIIVDIAVFVIGMSLTLCGYEEAFLIAFPIMMLISFIGTLIKLSKENESHNKSLKEWESKLHIHHKELNLPWDEPVEE